MKKKIIISVVWVVIIALVVFGFVLLQQTQDDTELIEPVEVLVVEPEPTPIKSQSVIGSSVEGRPIEVFQFGNGENHILFVGGIHGGYEWNSVLLAYAFVDYFNQNPGTIPEDVTISIIPSANPDGLFRVLQKEGRFEAIDVPQDADITLGRFNANEIDLNRNFDCKWAPESSWKGNVVSAGTEAFSEPEAVTIRDYVLATVPKAVVFWHSKANAVYASECEEGILPETFDIMNTYATAAGYNAISVFDAYSVTGDAEGWLASIGIPAITVELETRGSIEWERNLGGVQALLARPDLGQ